MKIKKVLRYTKGCGYILAACAGQLIANAIGFGEPYNDAFHRCDAKRVERDRDLARNAFDNEPVYVGAVVHLD